MAALEGRPRRAARLLGATKALHDAVDAGGWTDTANRLAWERNVARAQAQLDNQAWVAAWAEGSAMDVEAAVAYALDAERPEDSLTPML